MRVVCGRELENKLRENEWVQKTMNILKNFKLSQNVIKKFLKLIMFINSVSYALQNCKHRCVNQYIIITENQKLTYLL